MAWEQVGGGRWDLSPATFLFFSGQETGRLFSTLSEVKNMFICLESFVSGLVPLM